jgi:hypothetical protein
MVTAKDIKAAMNAGGKPGDVPKFVTQKERWEKWQPPELLPDCVKLLFEILDAVETSDEGRDFRPTHITSCRVWDTHRLNKLLPKMKELANGP